MEIDLCLDSCFLIDLQRELRRGRGPAWAFLEAHSRATLWTPAVAWGEFLEGRTEENAALFLDVRRAVELLPTTESVSECYGRIASELRAHGSLIGTNDLWIAATALEKGYPCVTRNSRDFRRIKNLRSLAY